jgi:hypothetical protein
MTIRSGAAKAALASLFAGSALAFCSTAVLMTAACGIRVSAQDFPVLRLSSATDAETPKK